jgi:hypothetical protein
MMMQDGGGLRSSAAAASGFRSSSSSSTWPGMQNFQDGILQCSRQAVNYTTYQICTHQQAAGYV